MSLNVGVIGAGSMGTAISQIIARNANKIYLYARKKEICEEINEKRYNFHYYPNIKLHDNIVAINDLNKLKDVDVLFLCVPSSAIRDITKKLVKIVSNDCIFVNTAKGLEKGTNKRMGEVIEEEIKKSAVVLSGPNIASEMVKEYLTTTTIASENPNELKTIENLLTSYKFKVNSNNDVIGTEYCGIIKNVIAISHGICEGLKISDNARFAVFTKSYNEIKDIIEQLGGMRDTVDDYCGFGDIVTASTLNVSRNHTLGVLYGQKIVIDEKASGVLFEGRNTTKIMKELCESLNYECLTVNFVYNVIIEKMNPQESFNLLWKKL